MTSIEQVLWLETDGPTATITLNRPHALNAIDRSLADRLAAAIKTVDRDDAVRVVIVTGAGRAFSAGQDLDELAADERTRGPEALSDELNERYRPILLRLRAIEKPVIAAINGVATGAGLGIALACDIRIASSDAEFVLSPIALGLIPAVGMTALLPLHLGLGKASELAFLGERIDAGDAERIGLVNRVVEPPMLMERAREVAARLAGHPPAALALTKRAFNHWALRDFPDHLGYEAGLQELAAASPEHQERLAAIIERRRTKERRT